MYKKLAGILLIFFLFAPISAKAQPSIINDKPVESSDYYAKQGDKILNYYIKLEDKSDRDRYLTAAKYFYYQANRLDISNANALIGRARVALLQNKVRDAKNNLFIALNFDENNPRVTFFLGEAFFQDGDYDDAIHYYTHAYLHGYRNNYRTNLKLGEAYEKMDDVERARYHYTNAIKIRPSEAEVRFRLQGLDVINNNNGNDIFKEEQKTEEKEEVDENPLTEEEVKTLPTN